MAVNRYYSNLSGEMLLNSAVSNADTVLTLSSVTGLPASLPFSLVVDVGSASEEVVTVSSVFGSNVTVTRGADGTAAVAHSAGSVVRHMATARDYSEPQAHIAATTGVHGLTGSPVGTTDTQGLTNKSMSGLSNTFTNIQKASLPGDVAYLATAQVLTNKTIDGALNTLSNVPKAAVDATTVYTTDTQTLTGKTMSGASNTFTAIPKTALPSDVVYDTTTTPGTFLATASGWSNSGSLMKVRNGVAYAYLAFIRTGAAITSTSGSGAVSDTLVCTLNAGYRPDQSVEGSCRYGGTTLGGARLLGDGSVLFFHGAPGVDLANGDSFGAFFSFPV